MKATGGFLITLAALFCATAWGQNDGGVIMREGKVTKAAVIDALDPPERMRNIKVEATGAPAKPAALSLLITFQTNSAELTPQAKATLDELGGALNADRLHDLSFQIEGHADPRGEEDINQRLSQARADSVRAYLVQTQSVELSRLKTVGLGERFPLRPDDPAAAENRRVTFKTIDR